MRVHELEASSIKATWLAHLLWKLLTCTMHPYRPVPCAVVAQRSQKTDRSNQYLIWNRRDWRHLGGTLNAQRVPDRTAGRREGMCTYHSPGRDTPLNKAGSNKLHVKGLVVPGLVIKAGDRHFEGILD